MNESKVDVGRNIGAASNFNSSVADMEAVRPTDIMDFIPDAILAIDLEGKVIAWNRAMEELTEVKAEDILGRTLVMNISVKMPTERFAKIKEGIEKAAQIL